MTSWLGKSEFFRRVLTAFMVVLALATLGRWHWGFSLLVFLGAVAVYTFFPRPSPPQHALTYERFPSQIGPDWLGFLVSGLLFAIPFWGNLSDPEFGWLHPSAVIVWPVAFMFVSFWLIGYAYATYWIVLSKGTMRIRTATSERDVSFDDIEKVSPYTKRLPKFVRYLAPFLVTSGHYGAAGAIMVARARQGITLTLKDGGTIDIASDSFEKEIREIRRRLQDHGVLVS